MTANKIGTIPRCFCMAVIGDDVRWDNIIAIIMSRLLDLGSFLLLMMNEIEKGLLSLNYQSKTVRKLLEIH